MPIGIGGAHTASHVISVILSVARSRKAGERKSKDPENAGTGNADPSFLTKKLNTIRVEQAVPSLHLIVLFTRAF